MKDITFLSDRYSSELNQGIMRVLQLLFAADNHQNRLE
jgi:hypothetical protein